MQLLSRKIKNKSHRLVLFFSCLVLYAGVCSAKPLAKKAGFGGAVGLNAGAIESQSQLSVSGDNAQITDLNSSGQAETKALAFPFFRFDYTFTDLTTQLFLGQSKENILNSAFQYELGVTHQFSDWHALTLAYIPHVPVLKETWADPYLTGSPRQETDVDSSAVRLAYRLKPVTIKYAYGFYNLDDERSGGASIDAAPLGKGQCDGLNCTAQEQALLNRNSHYQRVTMDSFAPVGFGFFTKPSVYYGRRDADGDSQSFIEYHYSLSVFTSFGPHFFSLQGAYTDREYEEENPIFSLLQQDVVTRYMFIYSYDQPFRLANSKLNILYQHKTLDSNIEFFDSQQQFVSLGISYSF